MNKLTQKLTAKTFFLLLLLSLSVCLLAYGCIWLFLPYANQKFAQKNLTRQTTQFVSNLWMTPKSDSGFVFTGFLRQTGAELFLFDHNGEEVNPFTLQKMENTEPDKVERNNIDRNNVVSNTPFRFADSDDEYVLVVRYDPSRTKEIKAAVQKSIPFVALAILLLSLVSALVFSHYTTKPIIRISRIADRIARLDFGWYCPDIRDDEIGVLSQSINELSDKLHRALSEISSRNDFLEDAILLEKERERRRMIFFSGVSHELKTPLAIVIGQLEGIQANVGVYKNREKYLARSAQILQSLSGFINEMLLISHMDMQSEPAVSTLNLSKMLEVLTADYADYAEPLFIRISSEITPDIQIYGDEALLKKALANVLGNAVTHSPEHNSVHVKLTCMDNKTVLTVLNTGAHIDDNDLPHLFEAFYRADRSAGHGSGLGLYITRMILENHQAAHSIENTTDGVKFTVVFANTSQH